MKVEPEGLATAEVQAPEPSPFGRVVQLLMDSYQGKRGRTLDSLQTKELAEGLLAMADTIEIGVAYTRLIEGLVFKMGAAMDLPEEEVYNLFAQIQQGTQLDDIEIKKRKKFWTP